MSSRLAAPSRSPRHWHLSRCLYPLARPSPYSRDDSTRRLTHRPLAPVRLFCPHPHRYYGLIRRSRMLRPASLVGYSGSVFVRSGLHPSPSLLCSDWPSRRAVTLTPAEFPLPGMGAFTTGLEVRPPLVSTRIGSVWGFVTRQQCSLYAAARRFVRITGPTAGDLHPRPDPFTAELAQSKVSFGSSLLWLLGSISLPRRDLHPLACQRSKAAQPSQTVSPRNPTGCWSAGVLGLPITPSLHHSIPLLRAIRNPSRWIGTICNCPGVPGQSSRAEAQHV